MNKKKAIFLFFFLSFVTLARAEENRKINEINFEINNEEKLNLKNEINSYIKKDINKENILSLMEDIKKKLTEDGYIVSNVDFKGGNANTGELVFSIDINKIEDIEIYNENNEKLDEELKLKFAFGKYKDEPLNIKRLDQGMENLNVRGFKHSMKIVPGEKENYSKVIITEKKIKNNFFEIGIDNNTANDKRANLNLSYQRTNLSKLNDSLKVSLINEFNNKVEINKNIVALNYSIPYSNVRLDYDFNLVYNMEKLKGKNGTFHNTNLSINNGFKVNAVLLRDNISKLDVTAGANLENRIAKIENRIINVQTNNNVNLNFDLKYKREINKGDLTVNSIIDYTINNNVILKLRTNYNKLYQVKDGIYLNLDTTLGINLSKEAYAIGSNSMVRGFKKTTLEGKYSGYSRNTLSLRMNKNNKYLDAFQPYVGFDFGASENGFIAGVGVGLNYNLNSFKTSISYQTGIITRSKQSAENIFKYSLSYEF